MSRFDEIIQQKANSHKATVPADAWNNIIKDKKKRNYGFFWWMTLLLLSGLGISEYYHYRNSDDKVDIIKKVNEVDHVPVVHKAGVNSVNGDDAANEIEKLKRVSTVENNKTMNPDNTLIVADKKDQRLIVEKDKVDRAIQVVEVNKDARLANPKNNRLIHKNNKQETAVLLSNPDKEKDDTLLTTKKRIIKKQKAKTLVKIQPGETDVADNKNERPDNAVAETEKTKKATESIAINEDKKTNDDAAFIKKDLVVDTAQKNTVKTTPVENNKGKTAVNKPAKKHAWFIDLGFSPIFTIQQYDHTLTFTRTLVVNNSTKAFSGKLTRTSIEPSVAFSAGIRREITKKISIATGFQYLQLKEHLHFAGTEINTKYEVINRLVNGITGPELMTDTVTNITEGTREINAVNSYQLISLPVLLQYNFMQSHSWSLGAVAGIYVNIYKKYVNEINKNTSAPLVSSLPTAPGKTNTGFSFYGGLRLGKLIGRRAELFAIPSINWTLVKQNIKNSLLNKNIQKAGLNIGLSYKIK